MPAVPIRKQMLSAGQKYKPQEMKTRSLSAIHEVSDEDPVVDDDDVANEYPSTCRSENRFVQCLTPPAIFENIAEEAEEDLDNDDEDYDDFNYEFPKQLPTR